MPAASRDNLHAQSGRPPSGRCFFFDSEQPTRTAIQTGLAVLLLLLALRFCLQRGAAWLRRQPRAQPVALASESAAPSPILGEKMRSRTIQYGSDAPEYQYISGNEQTRPLSAPIFEAMPGHQRRILTRLPPAPPLTPPELSATIFACGEDVDGFISQPNPDYMSATSSLPIQTTQPTHRRRSYMKTIPLAPLPMPGTGDEAPEEQAGRPSSYPDSPQLPATPPGSQDQDMPAPEDGVVRRSVEVKGEIISAVNEDGAGWTRHTRVYGGGACLACTASGGHEGGFYGATVTPEEMRH